MCGLEGFSSAMIFDGRSVMNLFVTVPTATLSDPGTSWIISNSDQVESSCLLLLACAFHWNSLDVSPCSRQLAHWGAVFPAGILGAVIVTEVLTELHVEPLTRFLALRTSFENGILMAQYASAAEERIRIRHSLCTYKVGFVLRYVVLRHHIL